jgi:hypothetical protein
MTHTLTVKEQFTVVQTNNRNEDKVLTKYDQYAYATANRWTRRTAELTSLYVVTPGSTDPLDHHTAAILPIAEASAFP